MRRNQRRAGEPLSAMWVTKTGREVRLQLGTTTGLAPEPMLPRRVPIRTATGMTGDHEGTNGPLSGRSDSSPELTFLAGDNELNDFHLPPSMRVLFWQISLGQHGTPKAFVSRGGFVRSV